MTLPILFSILLVYNEIKGLSIHFLYVMINLVVKMKILSKEKKLTVKVCMSFQDRFFGFMRKKKQDYGLFFPKCHIIHTCFMKFPVDVYIVDYNNIILYCKKQVKPWRIVFYKKGYGTYEFPVGLTDFQVGERIKQTN